MIPGTFSFHQTSLDLQESAPYTFSFLARANEPCDINANVRLDQDPWSGCGLALNVPLSTEWKRYEYTFKSEGTRPNHCRAGFNLNNRIGEFWFTDVSLRRGGWIGLPPDQTLEAGNSPFLLETPAQRSSAISTVSCLTPNAATSRK